MPRPQNQGIMASFRVPSLESLLKARALNREDLKVPCAAEECNKFALKLTRWEELRPFIGLDEQNEEEIRHNHSRYKRRKIGKHWPIPFSSGCKFLLLFIYGQSVEL